jgi:glutathione S-transferase
VSNFTEELKLAYGKKTGFDVEYKKINMGGNEQKEEWFLKINPNGRIPALVDPNRSDFKVFETAAILLYLEKHYDPEHLFSWPSSDPQAEDYRSEVLQWMFFVHGGVGPMQGQANHFKSKEIPYAKERYNNETKRLYSVLESRLSSRDYLVGSGRGKYSLADANGFPWVWWGAMVLPEKELLESFPNTYKWVKRCLERPASEFGMGATNGGKVMEAVSKMWSQESGLAHK